MQRNINKKILITPLFGIGDALLTTPALKILKSNYPEFHITFFTFNLATYELFKNNPNIDRLLYYPLIKKGKVTSLFYILKNFSFKFDFVINFYPSNRKDYNFFSFLSFAPKRVGHRYNNFDFKEFNWLKNFTIKENNLLHCVEENVKLLEFFDIKVPEKEIPELQIHIKEEEIEKSQSFLKASLKSMNSENNINIGIHPGSSIFKNHVHRRWPGDKFVELINQLPEFNFFIFAGNEDRDVCDYIYRQCNSKNVKKISNKSIREIASLIKCMNLFVSNDSGLMHLAAAVGTPVVAIFGPTNPLWVKPWRVKHKIVKMNLKCSPCFVYSPAPLTCKIKKKYSCLNELMAEDVVNAIKELL